MRVQDWSSTVLNRRYYPIYSSIFIVTFVALFRPFRVSSSAGEVVLISLLVISSSHTFLLYFYSFLIRRRFDIKKLDREFLYLIPFFLITGFLSKTLHVALGLSSFAIGHTLEWMFACLIVLPIPHAITLFGFNRSIFQTDNTTNFHGIYKDDIYLVKALENYVEIWFLDDEGIRKKKVVRSTMYEVENQLQSQFLRCHRSYIINSALSYELAGNARSPKIILNMDGERFQIPVSVRKYSYLQERT